MSYLYGLLGESLKHSMSPKIHSLLFKALNFEGHYHLFEVERDNLKTALHGLQVLGAKGVNVTIPFKIPIMDYLDELSPQAKKIGSINTICFENHRTIGHNTDYYGFGRLLHKYAIDTKNKKAVILGSGGAAKSVLTYLLDHSIRDISIVSRDVLSLKKDQDFKDFTLLSYKELEFLKEQDLIINCTPCGMHPHITDCPVEKSVLTQFSTAIDLIYNPAETLFLHYATEMNIQAINGLYMLVGQAIAAEELWNNIKISQEVTDEIYRKLR